MRLRCIRFQRPRHQRFWRIRQRSAALTVTILLIVSATLVWQGSYSAFSGIAGNPGNSWSAATISLSDDTSGAAVFDNVSDLIPGSTDTRCVLVIYTGDIASTVTLFTRDFAGTVGPHLSMTIHTGSGATCAAFGTPTTIFDGTVAALTTTATDHASGLPAVDPWTPSVSGAAKPYRFTYILGDDNAAEGAGLTVDLVWSARSN